MKASLEAEAIIGEALARLAIGRGGVVDERQGEVYLEDLADLSPTIVSRACERLRREPRQQYETALPDVGRIREVCKDIGREDAAEAVRQRLLPAPSDDDPRTWRHCRVCDDSGWEEFWCVGDSSIPQPDYRLHLTARDCGRPREHTSHTYVQRCDCINRNPVIARRRELEAQQVIRRTPKGKSS